MSSKSLVIFIKASKNSKNVFIKVSKLVKMPHSTGKSLTFSLNILKKPRNF
jgi:hypothetical protein